MSLYQTLAYMGARILVGLSLFVWGVVLVFDQQRTVLRPWLAVCVAFAVAALIGMRKGQGWASWPAAISLFAPIGIVAQHNGASPWLWIILAACIVATERWIRDGIR